MESKVPLHRKIAAEMLGTFMLVFFGCGVVHAAVLTDAQAGLWQVAVVWGLSIMMAIYCVGSISGAHINPAITISFAVWGHHRWSHVVPYILAQLLGAIAAAAVLFVLFAGFLTEKETEKGVQRGEPGSVVTAMCYGEYYPNPGGLATAEGPFDATEYAKIKSRTCFACAVLAEFLGTTILACVVFAMIDLKNAARPQSNLAPVFIGLTVSALISVIAPLTQAGFNPARDFGPRLFAYFAGWGAVALPPLTEMDWCSVYILAPIGGAITGGGIQRLFLHSAYPKEEVNE